MGSRKRSNGVGEPSDDVVAIVRVVLAQFAHELRAPLHNILSLCFTLVHSEEPRDRTELYAEMKYEIYRAKALIENTMTC